LAPIPIALAAHFSLTAGVRSVPDFLHPDTDAALRGTEKLM